MRAVAGILFDVGVDVGMALYVFFFEQLGSCPTQTAYSAYREWQYSKLVCSHRLLKRGELPIPLFLSAINSGKSFSSLCDWIQDFLTGRPQVVKVSQFTSNSITLNIGAPQGCVLSPLLYSLYTHDCESSHSST